MGREIKKSESSLFRMISTLLSIEMGAACSYSEPPLFGFTRRDGGNKMGMAMTFATVDSGLMFIEEPAIDLPPWVSMVGVFLKKRESGDNFFLINRKDFEVGHVRPMDFAQRIEIKMRINVSKT